MEQSLHQLVKESTSISDLARKMGKFPNTYRVKKLRNELISANIDYSHFSKNGHTPRKKITKICPICTNPFELKSGHKETQVTCSHACSNTYFAKARTTYKSYRAICFNAHGRKCVVCGEDKIVAVHHMDEDHDNKDKKNLIPLCPTHHVYWHSKYRYLVKGKIDDFISKIT